jgi:uridine kinase
VSAMSNQPSGSDSSPSSLALFAAAGAGAVALLGAAALGYAAGATMAAAPHSSDKGAPAATDRAKSSGSEGGGVPSSLRKSQSNNQPAYSYSCVGNDATPLASRLTESRSAAKAARNDSTSSSTAEETQVAAAWTSSDLALQPGLHQGQASTSAVKCDALPGFQLPAGAVYVGSPSAVDNDSVASPKEMDFDPKRIPIGVPQTPERVAAGRTRPLIIGVGGASGSGKTSVSSILKAQLPMLKVAAISGDSYYKPLGHDVDASNYNFDTPAAIDFDLLADHLLELRTGAAVEIPHYDFATHSRLADTTLMHGVDVIIVDGIFTLAVDKVRELCDLTLFTLEDLDVCLARRLKRDILQRGRDVSSVLDQYERFVKPGFHMFISPTMRYADVIVPRGECFCRVAARSFSHPHPRSSREYHHVGDAHSLYLLSSVGAQPRRCQTYHGASARLLRSIWCQAPQLVRSRWDVISTHPFTRYCQGS